ncbi:hypothetical protein ABZ756_02665 [Mammaliicoccus sciuri]|uniref:hypothetical protein n=1 Tax=Sporosarcina sp. FSL K6-3508 TaxID=2921557 RepID=UPI00315B3C25
MVNKFFLVVVVGFGAFMIITKDIVMMPLFIILLGVALVPGAIKEIKSKEDESGNFGAYMNITIFGLIFAYFLFLLLSGHLYQ